jgi:ThiF family
MTDRFERQERLFGVDGQAKLASSRVAVVGVGGLGTHVVQQLALLGVGGLAVVDAEELATTDRNRYVGARHDDPVPGTSKVDIAERIVKAIDPTIEVVAIRDSLISERGLAAVTAADYVFGCLDSEGARLVLTELCAAYAKPYLDLASDILPGEPPTYGGRVCSAWDGHGCLVCYGLLDVAEAQADLAGVGDRRNRDALYGVKRMALGRSGPSVVTINGVVASLGVTEFMVAVTALRAPCRVLTYRGHLGGVGVLKDEPAADCYYCRGIRGTGAGADAERYLRADIGAFLRGVQ